MFEAVSGGMQLYGGTLAGAGGRASRALQPRDALAVALYDSPAYAVTVPPLPVARLSINLSASQVDGRVDGSGRRIYMARRHSLFLTPAGAGAEWRKSSSSRHINIYFDPRAFDDPDDAAWGPLLSDAVPLLNANLAGAGPLFEMLAAEMAERRPFATEAVDSLARLILVGLARRRPQPRRSSHPPEHRAQATEPAAPSP